MNLPLKIIEDKPLTKEDFRPFRIVSIWDIIRFYARDILQMCRTLDHISRNIMVLPNPDAVISGLPSDLYSSLCTNIKLFHQNLVIMDLKCSAMSMERLLETLTAGANRTSPTQLLNLIRDTIARLEDELSGELVMLIPKHRSEFYKRKGTFVGEDVSSKLDHINGLREDAEEAGNCFAAGRYTACVFHLMRVMDRCLQEMGKTMGVPFEITYNKEWQTIIGQIRHEMKSLYPKDTNPDRIKYETMLALLETIKIAWRNTTMHPKNTYTGQQAEEIIRAVKAFMRPLVELPTPPQERDNL
jgi:hypothetical protein